MPTPSRRGKTALYVEVTDELKEHVEALATQRGNTLAQEVREALRRHLADPPPVAPLRARGRKQAEKKT